MRAQAISFAAGEDWVGEFTADATPGESINTWNVTMVFRREDRADTAAPDLALTVGSGITLTHPKISAKVTSAQSLALGEAQRYLWELWRTDNGANTRLAFGPASVLRAVRTFP